MDTTHEYVPYILCHQLTTDKLHLDIQVNLKCP